MSSMPQELHAPTKARPGDADSTVARPHVLLVALVTLAAAGAIAATATLPIAGLEGHPVALLTLLALAGLAGSRAIRITPLRIEVTAGDAFMFGGLLVVGPLAAPLIALTGVLGTLTVSRRRRPLRILFNVSTVTLAAALAAHTCRAIAGRVSLDTAAGSLGLLASVPVFVLVNTVLVALAIRAERRRSFGGALRSFIGLAANAGLTSLLIGLGLYTLYASLGSVALLAGLSSSLILGAAARRLRDRIRDDAPANAAAPSA